VSPLGFRTFPLPVATLVTISGEVDIATVAELREHLRAIPDRHTVVEMSGVALLSAAGLTVLLELQDRLARPESSRSTRRKAGPFSRSSDCSPTRRQLKVRGTSGCRTVPVATHGYPGGWLTNDG
jgi:STAS domain